MCSRGHSAAADAAVEFEASNQAALAAPVELAVSTRGDACHSDKVNLMRMIAPKCFEPCQASCAAMGRAVDEYSKHGKAAAQASVCQNQGAFRCFVAPAHVAECELLIRKAAKMGYSMPRSEGELNAMCSQAHTAAAESAVEVDASKPALAAPVE